MTFDDSLSDEDRDRLLKTISGLEILGLEDAKTVSIVIAGCLLTIDPRWITRFGNRLVVEMATCLELGLLTVAYVVPGGDALFIGGPAVCPQVNENPELIFDIFGAGEYTHEVAHADHSGPALAKMSSADAAMAYDAAGLSKIIKWVHVQSQGSELVVNASWAKRVTGVPLSIEIASGFERGHYDFRRVDRDALHIEVRNKSLALLMNPELLFGFYAPGDDGGSYAGGYVHPATGAFRLN